MTGVWSLGHSRHWTDVYSNELISHFSLLYGEHWAAMFASQTDPHLYYSIWREDKLYCFFNAADACICPHNKISDLVSIELFYFLTLLLIFFCYTIFEIKRYWIATWTLLLYTFCTLQYGEVQWRRLASSFLHCMAACNRGIYKMAFSVMLFSNDSGWVPPPF